jgi:hypothetical protein
MTATETSGVWAKAVKLADPSSPPTGFSYFGFPTTLSCADLGDCTSVVAFGSYAKIGLVVFHEVSGTWQPPALVSTTRFLDPTSLSCTAATTCMAVGSFGTTTGSLPAYMTETAGTWSGVRAVSLPRLSPVSKSGAFNSVRCVGTRCEAVGSLTTSTTSVPMAATYASGAWSSIGIVQHVPAGAKAAAYSSLLDVGCAAGAGTCLGIGIGFDAVPCESCATRPVEPFSTGLVPAVAVGRPGPPIVLAVTPHTGAATVTWLPPWVDGGAAVRSYTVTVSPGGAHCTTVPRACRFTGLHRGSSFVFSVTDTNGHETSSPTRSRPITIP